MDFFAETREGGPETKIRRPVVLWISQCNCGTTFVEETEKDSLRASAEHECREWIPTTVLIGVYVAQEAVTP